MNRLLSLVLLVAFAALAACSKSSPTEPTVTRTYIRLVLDQQTCQARVSGYTTGNIYTVSTDWASGTVTLHPGTSVDVQVPYGGAYRIHFTGKFTDGKSRVWDYTFDAPTGKTHQFTMTCGT